MIFLRRTFHLARLSVGWLLLPVLVGALHEQTVTKIPGLTVGDKIPSIFAKDQTGSLQTFDMLKGKHGLLLLFSRSADWCPFCKQQLLELQQAKQEFEAKGIHVASITYDSQAILKSFADRKRITYPMLSDPQSQIIRAFGVLNPDGKGFAAGIPYPGMYYITPDGIIRKRFFEAQYYDRFTPKQRLYGDIRQSPADRAAVCHSAWAACDRSTYSVRQSCRSGQSSEVADHSRTCRESACLRCQEQSTTDTR